MPETPPTSLPTPDKNRRIECESPKQSGAAEVRTSEITENNEVEANDGKRLAETRKQISRVSYKQKTTNTLATDAMAAMEEFEISKKIYDSIKEKYGLENHSVLDKLPPALAKAINATKTVTRMVGAMLTRSRGAKLETEQTLKSEHIEVTVLERDKLFDENETNVFLRLLNDPNTDKRAVEALLRREVFKEINCDRFLMIKGLTLEQFYALAEKMGDNPHVFLSDDREESARYAKDNTLMENGEHPFPEGLAQLPAENQVIENQRWQKIFPKAPKWLPWSKWSWSRNHSVIYDVGNEILLMPIHIDPKNSIAKIGEVWHGVKKGERGALAYHQLTGGKDKSYIGTGLYNLGCEYFIKCLDEARKKGSFQDLKVFNEESLRTTGTILGDDQMTWEISERVKSKTGLVNETA